MQVIRTSRCSPDWSKAAPVVASVVLLTDRTDTMPSASRCAPERTVTRSPFLIDSSREKKPRPPVVESTCPAMTVEPYASPTAEPVLPGLTLSLQACAAGKPPLLHVRQDLPWRTALVIVQLDLPER